MTPTDLPEGTVLRGKYRVEKVLGEGGMGRVLLATHRWLDQKVAIKVLTETALAMPHVVERFAREARAAVKLRNDHVVRILDVDEDEDGMPFMVMEYLEGQDLAQMIRTHGALPVEEAVGYVLEACEGVAEAHAVGIVHRDIKPSNLFLAKQGDGKPVLKLLDFGISKSDSPKDLALTGTQMALGSPRYMAPEQLRGAKHVGQRADIWSLGVVLYQLITGVQPFDGATATEVAARIAADAPVPPSAMKDVPAGVEKAILRCLAKNPDERFASVRELADSLAPFAPTASAALAAARLTREVPDDAPTLRNLPEEEVQAAPRLSSRNLITGSTTNAPAVNAPAARAGPSVLTSILVAGLGGIVLGLGAWFFMRGSPRSGAPAVNASEQAAVAASTALAAATPPTAAPPPRPADSVRGGSIDAGVAAPAATATHKAHSAGAKAGLELELK